MDMGRMIPALVSIVPPGGIRSTVVPSLGALV
jgi:hypothetical protein